MEKGKSIGGIQIGTSFLVLIFVVLALVIFCVLSLLSALSDNKLTEKNQAAVLAFYQADSIAEEKLAEVDRNISLAALGVLDESAFQEALKERFKDSYDAQEGIISYGVPINESLRLLVELQVCYEGTVPKGYENYKILRWQEENISDYEIDDSLNLWTGEEQ